MRKKTISVSIILAICAMLPLQSCIGSFALTNKVLTWNNQVGSKFINELVFFAFWILPVYEVTSLADLVILNSIEFWSGNNPVEAYEKTVVTDHGQYYIACDQNGYRIKAPNGRTFSLNYDNEDSTWSIKTSDEDIYPFMTMVDASHVKMITPDGSFYEVELSQQGLLTYTETVGLLNLACR
ncbi:MAG: DUF3332 domain-containing protein [Muribaculaceae bacterium]|nr:DUF3332 domain-containing protein [Muribaculaceae bacterium]